MWDFCADFANTEDPVGSPMADHIEKQNTEHQDDCSEGKEMKNAEMAFMTEASRSANSTEDEVRVHMGTKVDDPEMEEYMKYHELLRTMVPVVLEKARPVEFNMQGMQCVDLLEAHSTAGSHALLVTDVLGQQGGTHHNRMSASEAISMVVTATPWPWFSVLPTEEIVAIIQTPVSDGDSCEGGLQQVGSVSRYGGGVGTPVWKVIMALGAPDLRFEDDDWDRSTKVCGKDYKHQLKPPWQHQIPSGMEKRQALGLYVQVMDKDMGLVIMRVAKGDLDGQDTQDAFIRDTRRKTSTVFDRISEHHDRAADPAQQGRREQ